MAVRIAVVAAALALAACSMQTAPVPTPPPPVPALKLDGGPWVAEDVNGGGVPDGARIELNFDGDRVSGRSGCNRLTGTWSQDGATVRFGALGTTRMACPPALMDIETKVLAVLAEPLTIRVDATGAMTLAGSPGRSLRLRLERR